MCVRSGRGGGERGDELVKVVGREIDSEGGRGRMGGGKERGFGPHEEMGPRPLPFAETALSEHNIPTHQQPNYVLSPVVFSSGHFLSPDLFLFLRKGYSC